MNTIVTKKKKRMMIDNITKNHFIVTNKQKFLNAPKYNFNYSMGKFVSGSTYRINKSGWKVRTAEQPDDYMDWLDGHKNKWCDIKRETVQAAIVLCH